MKNLFAILFLALCVNANAQLIDKFSIGVNGGILFSEYAQSRTGEPGFSTAFMLELPVGDFAISSGVEVTNYGEQYNFNDIRLGTPEDPAYAIMEVTSYRYQYVGIPIRLKYNFKMLYAQIGVKPEFFMNQSVKDLGLLSDPGLENEPFLDINDIRKNNLTTELAIGFNWSPKWTNFGLYLEPTLSYMTKPIFENSELEANQVAYGIKVGAKYTFTK